jgi:hypothetical protein
MRKNLKFFKEFKHLRSIMKEINPSKFTKIINETHIVFLMTKGVNCRTPNIRINEL